MLTPDTAASCPPQDGNLGEPQRHRAGAGPHPRRSPGVAACFAARHRSSNAQSFSPGCRHGSGSPACRPAGTSMSGRLGQSYPAGVPQALEQRRRVTIEELHVARTASSSSARTRRRGWCEGSASSTSAKSGPARRSCLGSARSLRAEGTSPGAAPGIGSTRGRRVAGFLGARRDQYARASAYSRADRAAREALRRRPRRPR